MDLHSLIRVDSNVKLAHVAEGCAWEDVSEAVFEYGKFKLTVCVRLVTDLIAAIYMTNVDNDLRGCVSIHPKDELSSPLNQESHTVIHSRRVPLVAGEAC